MGERARPAWERTADHDQFRRCLRAQGLNAIQAIYVIRSAQGCDLKGAIEIYDSYWHRTQVAASGKVG